MRNLILRNHLAPGDVLMLTASVRDLMRGHGDRFSVDVRTTFPSLWENNPLLTQLPDSGSSVEVIECEYPSIDNSNRLPGHFVGAFHSFLTERLAIPVSLSDIKGDIYLSKQERFGWPSKLEVLDGSPYWLVSAGGKRDFTIKWWDRERYQSVVDHFRDRIMFVQVGAQGHFHPRLEGAIDLRGKTSIRELIHLVHHSAGVLSPVSFLMHLAAAVEPSARMRSLGYQSRPCVVIAGGREPLHWEAYPTHQFIHTVGALSCCQSGGCWRSRTRALGDGTEHDSPRRLCVDVVKDLPRCMDMITAGDVIRRIELYLEGRVSKRRGGVPQLKADTRAAARESIDDAEKPLTVESAAGAFAEKSLSIGAYPTVRFSGRGIVICAGGQSYIPCAWVCIQMLRRTGCLLQVEIWHFGDSEFPAAMRALFEPLGVVFVDASRLRRRFPVRRLGGWELKSYALIHSRFEEVLLLDADNVPLVDPEFLFETPEYEEHGAVFWPDIGRMKKDAPIWAICDIPPREEPEFESGQIVVNKRRCWKALSLALWMNEHSDFFYKHVHGDKETFHLAFRKLEQPYAMPDHDVRILKATMCQHDFNGRIIFQHRNLDKWRLDGRNIHVPGFAHEAECRAYLAELRALLPEEEAAGLKEPSGTIPQVEPKPAAPSPATIQPPAAVAPSNRIVFRGPINAYTGYGLHSLQIVTDLERFGHEVVIRPMEITETFARIPRRIRKLFELKEVPDEWELLLHPPNIPVTPGKKTIYFTMWEASRLPKEWVGFLNQAECVVVPCQWNATCFSASGVDRPIHVVPLGIKTDIFKYAPMDMTGPLVFGTAGKMRGGGERKSLNEAIALFQQAFPVEEDVRFHVKAFPDCGVQEVPDERVTVTAAFLDEKQMFDWYAGLTCFLSLSRSEGWGLMPHQAMAVGRPCIGMSFGGHAEYLNEHVGYPVGYRLTPASYNYSGGGVWAEPDTDQVVELMRRVYRNRKECERRGRVASKAARRLSWEESNRKLLRILEEAGAVAPRPRVEGRGKSPVVEPADVVLA